MSLKYDNLKWFTSFVQRPVHKLRLEINLRQYLITTQACFEPGQTSNKIERFPKIVNGFKALTTFTKCCILDIWQGSK